MTTGPSIPQASAARPALYPQPCLFESEALTARLLADRTGDFFKNGRRFLNLGRSLRVHFGYREFPNPFPFPVLSPAGGLSDQAFRESLKLPWIFFTKGRSNGKLSEPATRFQERIAALAPEGEDYRERAAAEARAVGRWALAALVEPAEALEATATLAEIYSSAGQIPIVTSDISRKFFSKSVFTLFDLLQSEQTLRYIVTHREKILETSRKLDRRMPFVARLYIEALFEDYSDANTFETVWNLLLSNTGGHESLTQHLRETEEIVFRRALFSRQARERQIETAKIYSAFTPLTSQAHQQLGLTHAQDLLAYSTAELERAAYFAIIPVGLAYLDERSENQNAGTRLVVTHELQVVFSEKVFRAAFSLAKEYLVALYGQPQWQDESGKHRSRIAILLGGANARHEFPSFDYDTTAVFEKDGETSGGLLGTTSNRIFSEELMKVLDKTLTGVGRELDFLRLLPGKSIVSLAEAQTITPGPESALVHTNLIFGAGDASLAEIYQNIIYEKIFDSESTRSNALATRHEWIREERSRYAGTSIRNLKAVTLREVTALMTAWSLIHKRATPNPSMLFEDLAVEGYLSGEESAALEEAYQTALAWRIQLDLFFGRNQKNLPTDTALERFVRSTGYDSPEEFNQAFASVTNTIRTKVTKVLTRILKEQPSVREKLHVLIRERDNSSLKDSRFAEVRDAWVQIIQDALPDQTPTFAETLVDHLMQGSGFDIRETEWRIREALARFPTDRLSALFLIPVSLYSFDSKNIPIPWAAFALPFAAISLHWALPPLSSAVKKRLGGQMSHPRRSPLNKAA